MALLFDQLMHPNADLGAEQEPCLKWCHHGNKAIKHLVVGCGPPGGSWHNMKESQLTLSLNNWLELPGFGIQDWLRDHRCETARKPCNLVENGLAVSGDSYDRATTGHLAEYYKDYVNKMDLSKNFWNDAKVFSVRPIACYGESACCDNISRFCRCWEVSGICDLSSEHPRQFSITAANVVLATGVNVPKMLKIPGEKSPFVFHELNDLCDHLKWDSAETLDPCLVIGCGLSAGDAILALQNRGIPVVHSFRRAAKDVKIIFNQLPEVVYPEYYRVRQMIRGELPVKDVANTLYTGYPKTQVVDICKNQECTLERANGTLFKVKVSYVLVLIGASPDLAFLHNTQQLGIKSDNPVDCKRNPVDINPFSYEAVQEPGLFAIGPLAGDNFVRFGLGGSLGIANHFFKGDE